MQMDWAVIRRGRNRLSVRFAAPAVPRLKSRRAPIENAATTPIPASPVAPVPTRPTALSHQIDKVRHANLEQAGCSQDRSRSRMC